MIIGRRRSQSDGDGAFGVFRRIGDELVDDKPQRDAECCRYLDIHTLHRDGALRSVLEEQTLKVLAQVMDILLELHSLLMIEHMQLPLHTSQRSDSISRNTQLRGRFGRACRPAL